MSFPRYPEYKDSGVEWLGEVPAHWLVTRVQDIATVINGYPFDARLFESDGRFPLIRIRDLDTNETATRYQGEFVPYAAVTSADVLIGMDGDFNVGRWLGSEPALLNQRMCCVRTDSQALTDLLGYALPAPLKTINDVTYATTVKHLSSFQVQKTRVAFPEDAAELSALVSFLDHETSKIDALVAEQEKLIALLKEKRQAVISQAVTRSVNPGAPLKDSGIEWLGEVPAHWEVLAVRRVIDRIEQGWSPECESRPAEPTEWGVLKAGCVNRGVYAEAENKALPSQLQPAPEYEVQVGDLLMSRASGSPELVGSVAYIETTRPSLMLSDKIFRIKLGADYDSRFFAAVFNSANLRGQIEQAISGAEGLANNLPQASLKCFYVPMPTVEEQRSIVVFLRQEVSRIETLSASAESAIALLKERRSALISAAVTGKIDVRGFGAQKEAA